MPALPILSGREAVRAFASLGWVEARRRGSHIVLVRDGSDVTLSVPDHRELGRGTLRGLIRCAELTVQEFLSAWQSL